MAQREEEFWEDAKLRYPTLLAAELAHMENQINSGGSFDLSWLPYGHGLSLFYSHPAASKKSHLNSLVFHFVQHQYERRLKMSTMSTQIVFFLPTFVEPRLIK